MLVNLILSYYSCSFPFVPLHLSFSICPSRFVLLYRASARVILLAFFAYPLLLVLLSSLFHLNFAAGPSLKLSTRDSIRDCSSVHPPVSSSVRRSFSRSLMPESKNVNTFTLRALVCVCGGGKGGSGRVCLHATRPRQCCKSGFLVFSLSVSPSTSPICCFPLCQHKS